MYENGSISLQEIIDTLPHKFKNGTNVKIIFNAFLKQYNKIIASYVDSMLKFEIDSAVGDQLDKIGKNFLVSRGDLSDEDYRTQIKLYWAIYTASGNIGKINTILVDYFDLSKDIIYIYEDGNANVVIDLNKNNTIEDITSMVSTIILSTKPLGVGFKIEPYSSTKITDTYLTHTIESIIDRWFYSYMTTGVLMDDAKHLYDTYYGNVAIDRYESTTKLPPIEYEEVEDENVDLVLQQGYYEIIDADGSQYSVYVGDDLLIDDNEVITDVSGYVRLQGVKFPCSVAIRSYPTLNNNAEDAYIELESDFPSSTAVKSLNRIFYAYMEIESNFPLVKATRTVTEIS